MNDPRLIPAVWAVLAIGYFWYRVSTATTQDDFCRIGAMSQYGLVVTLFGLAVMAISSFDSPTALSPTFAFILLSLSVAVFFLRTFELTAIVMIGALGSLIDYLSFFPRSIPINVAFWISLVMGTIAARLIFRWALGARTGPVVIDRIARESWR